MDTQIMLKQMCKSELNDSDLKAISKSRGFPAKEATSRDIFENFYLSMIGIKEALNSLTYEEVVFLQLLNKVNKEVDIEYFERLYSCARPASGYDYRTFTQRYKETFNKVKNNLIRKGVLIFIEREVYSSSTKLERLRFGFHPEFGDFLPPIVRASKFIEAGDFKREILRDKLLEIIGGQVISPLSKERSFTLTIKDGDLSIGAEKFRVSHLLKWQRACWQTSVEANFSTPSGDMNPIEVTIYALSQLQEHEWLTADALAVMLKIFTGVEKDNPEHICEAGWEWGCLAKVVADGKIYYRLPENLKEDTTSPEHYLHVKPDGTLTLDLMTIPYIALEILASISILEVHNSKLRVAPSLIKIGNAPETFRKNNVYEWLKENSSSKRYDVPWKTLESRGYIAEAICTEYRIPLSSEEELKYAHADKRAKFRIAAENQRKKELVRELLDNHAGESILIIGQFISQLEKLAKVLGVPIISGKIWQKNYRKLLKVLAKSSPG